MSRVSHACRTRTRATTAALSPTGDRLLVKLVVKPVLMNDESRLLLRLSLLQVTGITVTATVCCRCNGACLLEAFVEEGSLSYCASLLLQV
jgi:hypothetical protein